MILPQRITEGYLARAFPTERRGPSGAETMDNSQMLGGFVTDKHEGTTTRRRYALMVLAAYGVFRLLNLGLFAIISGSREETVLDFLLSWDSRWLIEAAEDGWVVPQGGVAEASQVQSTWAWPPLAALLARVLSVGLGLDPGISLILINVTMGAVGALFLWRVVAEILGDRLGVVAAVMWSAMPSSPVLFMGYAEGLFVAFAFAALLAMQRGSFLSSGLLLIPAGLTKLQVAPFAAALVVVVFYHRWRKGPSAVSNVGLLSTVALAGVSVLAWPAYVAFRFGVWNAYSQVQAAWNYWESIPFAGSARWLIGLTAQPNRATLFAFLAVAVAVAAVIVIVRAPRISLAFKTLSVAGPVFLLAVGAGASTVRYVLSFPAIPVALAMWARSRWQLALVMGVLLASQVAWVIVFVSAGPTEMPP